MTTQYQQPDLATRFPSGDRPIDVCCRNAVFEIQKSGKLDARRKPDGSSETPEEQAVRCLGRADGAAQYVR